MLRGTDYSQARKWLVGNRLKVPTAYTPVNIRGDGKQKCSLV